MIKYSPILYKIFNNERLMKQHIPKLLLLIVVVSKRSRISAFLFGSPATELLKQFNTNFYNTISDKIYR